MASVIRLSYVTRNWPDSRLSLDQHPLDSCNLCTAALTTTLSQNKRNQNTRNNSPDSNLLGLRRDSLLMFLDAFAVRLMIRLLDDPTPCNRQPSNATSHTNAVQNDTKEPTSTGAEEVAEKGNREWTQAASQRVRRAPLACNPSH